MTKPTTAELRAFLKRNLPVMLDALPSDQFDQGLTYGSALLERLAEPEPAAGKVSRLDKWFAANSAHGHAWERAKAAERKGEVLLAKQYERDAVACLAMRADHTEPVLPEGWEVERRDNGDVWLWKTCAEYARMITVTAYDDIKRCDIEDFEEVPLPVARAFLLACADAIAQAIEEEGAAMTDQQERERVWVACNQCKGTGLQWGGPIDEVFDCPRCNGEGGWYLEEKSDD